MKTKNNTELKNSLMSKSLFTIAIAVAFAFSTQAQSPALEWQSALGGEGTDQAYSIIQTNGGSYVIAGNSYSMGGDVSGNHGGADVWLAKKDNGHLLDWQKSLGGEADDFASAVIPTSDGGFAIAGYSESTTGDLTLNQGMSDYWIVKLDSDGVMQWQKSYGGSDVDQAYSITQTADGGYAVAGLSRSIDGDVHGNHGENDMWILKLDASGNLVWQASLGGSTLDEAYSIIQTADGGYAVAGVSASNDGDVSGHHSLIWNDDAWIVKLNSTGVIEWQKSLGGSAYDIASSIIQTTDGGYAVAATSKSPDGDVTGNHGLLDFWIIKLSNAGAITWQKSVGGSANEESASIVQTADGGFAIAGSSSSNDGDISGNHGQYDYLAIKLSGAGLLEWQKSMGGSGADLANSIVRTNDGGLALVGYTYSMDGDVSGQHGTSSPVEPDFWLVKLSEGVVAGVENTENKVALNLYPNPANSQMMIEANGASVEQINIYETGGRLVSQIKPQHNNSIDVSQMPEGVYIAEIKTKDAVQKLRWVKM